MLHRPQRVVCTCLALLSIGAAAVAAAAQAKQEAKAPAVGALSAADKQHVLEDTFVITKTVQALPKSVLSGLLGSSVLQGMANPDQPFQTTDVIGSRLLPFRRLVFAGASDGYCLIYNEYGGFGYGTEVSLYRLSAAGQAKLVWRATVQASNKLLDLPQLRNAIRDGKYDNRQLTDYSPPPPKPPPALSPKPSAPPASPAP